MNIEVIKIKPKPKHIEDSVARNEQFEKFLEIVKKYKSDKNSVIRCTECQCNLNLLDEFSEFFIGINQKTQQQEWFCKKCAFWASGLEKFVSRPDEYKYWCFGQARLTKNFMETHFSDDMKQPEKELSFDQKFHWILKGDYGLLEAMTNEELLQAEERTIREEPKVVTMPNSSICNRAYFRLLNQIKYQKFKRGDKNV